MAPSSKTRRLELTRRLENFKVEGNSLARWHQAKNPLAVAWNFVFIQLSRYAPSLRLKRLLLRATGMKVGRGAAVGQMASFDFFFPELIELGEDCIIGFNAAVLSHEFLQGKWRKGRTVIGKNALVGANSTLLAGTRVGENAVVSAMTLVNGDVPDGAFAQGVPMRVSKR